MCLPRRGGKGSSLCVESHVIRRFRLSEFGEDLGRPHYKLNVFSINNVLSRNFSKSLYSKLRQFCDILHEIM